MTEYIDCDNEFVSLFLKKETHHNRVASVINVEGDFGSNIEITLSKASTKKLGLALLEISRSSTNVN